MENKKETQKSEEKPKAQKPRQDKQLYWILGVILGVMIGLIAIFLVSSVVTQRAKTIEYEGITFTEEMFGDIQLFKYFYVTDTTPATGRAIEGADPRPVTVYLRGNPAENTVPVYGEISLIGGKKVYMTIADGLNECQYSTIAVASLSSFFSQNGFALEAALTDKENAERDNLPWVTCWNKQDNPVIVIQPGEETSVRAVNGNCYEITANNCEILPAAEKFIVQTIIDARKNPA